MESNRICGAVLSKDTAQHYLDLTLSLYNNIVFTLGSNKTCQFAKQKQSTWTISAARHPDPLDKAISITKSVIASRHTSFYEEWKGIKYREYSVQWPESLYRGSLWNSFARAMDQDQPMYQLRNWFSHYFGRRTTTHESEQEHFEKLIQGYKDVLPVLEELIERLELGIEDESAWVPSSAVHARLHDNGQPEYTKDCGAVQVEMQEEQEKFRAMIKQAEIEETIRLAKEAEERENPWGCGEWVQTDDVGEIWGEGAEVIQDAVSWSIVCVPDGEVEFLQDPASDADEEAPRCTEDLPASVPWDAVVEPVECLEAIPALLKQEDHAYDSGYEDDDGPGSHCTTCTCRLS